MAVFLVQSPPSSSIGSKSNRKKEDKRPRIEKETSTTSDLEGDTDSIAGSRLLGRRRGDSLGSIGAMSSTSGQPSPVSLSALKPSSYPFGMATGYPASTSSSLSTDRREPYQHSPRPPQFDESGGRPSQGLASQQMSRAGLSESQIKSISLASFSEGKPDYPAMERGVTRESFRTKHPGQSSSRISLLHEDSSRSSSQYQNSPTPSLQRQGTSSMSSVISSHAPSNPSLNSPSGSSSYPEPTKRPSLPPISSIALRPSDNSPSQRHGFSLPPPQQMSRSAVDSSNGESIY